MLMHYLQGKVYTPMSTDEVCFDFIPEFKKERAPI